MKPQIFALCAFLILSVGIRGQTLQNTKWFGVVNVPSPENVEIEFKKHTASLLMDGETIEYMYYMQEGNTLFIKKYWSGSPFKADDDRGGEYKVEIKKDELFLVLIQDKCSERIESLNKLKLKRSKK